MSGVDPNLFDDGQPAEEPASSSEIVLRANVERLLRNIGDPGKCKLCPAAIMWVLHRNGRKTPYDLDGTNHFVTCPFRDRFKTAVRHA